MLSFLSTAREYSGIHSLCPYFNKMLYKPLNHDNNVLNMILFYISTMPLFYWFLQRFFDNGDVRVIDILKPFAAGLVFAFPVILFYWAIDVYFGLKWNAPGLYFYTLFNKEGFIYFPLLALILGLYWKKNGRDLYLRELLGIFCGYFFMFAIIDTLNGDVFTTYDLILLPLVRFITMAGASLLINRFMRASGNSRYMIIATLVAFPLILNFLPLLYLLNKTILFYLVFIPAFSGAIYLCSLEMRGKLPG